MREIKKLKEQVEVLQKRIVELELSVAYLKTQVRKLNSTQLRHDAMLEPIHRDWMEHIKLVKMGR